MATTTSSLISSTASSALSSTTSGLTKGTSLTFVAISTYDPGVSTIFPSTVTSTAPSFTSTGTTASQISAQAAIAGPPYIQVQVLGGLANRSDLAACSLGLFLFLLGAFAHFFLFQHGRNRGRTFPMAIAIAIFCIIRAITLSLRLGWSISQTNSHLALASSIFIVAGTVILYVVNLVMTGRVVRSQHRQFGSSLPFKVLGRILVVWVIITFLLLITAGVQASYTLDLKIRRADRMIQLYGTTFNSAISFLPIPTLLLSIISAHRSWRYAPSTERRRLLMVFCASFLLTFHSVWICVALWQPIASESHPLEWYYAKPVYYTVALIPELMIVYLLALGRFDRYFFTNPYGNFSESNSKTVSPDPSEDHIVRFPDLATSPEPKRGWSPPRREEPRRQLQGPYGPYVNSSHAEPIQAGDFDPRIRFPATHDLSPVTEEYKPPFINHIEYQQSHESLVPPTTSSHGTPIGYRTPNDPITPKRSMEFPKQSLEYPLFQPDIEAYPMPPPPAQVLRAQAYPSQPASPQPRRPSLSMITSLSSNGSLADMLRMSRSSIMIDPNGTWSIVTPGQYAPQGGITIPFGDAPPIPAMPSFVEQADSRASIATTNTFGSQMPLKSHPVHNVGPQQYAIAQHYQVPQSHQPHQQPQLLQSQQSHQQPQSQSHFQSNMQPQQAHLQHYPMPSVPTFSHKSTAPNATRPRSISLGSMDRSSGSSTGSPDGGSESSQRVSPLRPAMKRASKSATPIVGETGKQVSFVSNSSARVSSMGFSTLIAMADGISEYRGSTAGSEEWWDGTTTRRTMTN